MNAVGARMRQARERVGMSQTRLAEAAGVDRSTISGLERGDGGSPNVATVSAIAQALGLPVATLLGEQPPPIHWPVDRVFWRQVAREIDTLRGVA